MKKIVAMLVIVMALSMAGCGTTTETKKEETGKLSVVTTIFPYYDFIREIAQDKVEVTMLVSAGKDSHSFEPSPQDMITIQEADLFVYNGGEMESWVEQILDAIESDSLVTDCMFDYVTALEEEIVEGMEDDHGHDDEDHDDGDHDEEDHEENHEEEVEYDEHIWTSPVNAQIIVNEIAAKLSEVDPENKEFYEANAASYCDSLQGLDEQLREVVAEGARNLILVGDKFPFQYIMKEYGLEYYAAFPGCSTETEPSADTIAFLIKKTEEENIPVVYYTEQSNQKIADTISESTGAQKLLLHSAHTVSQSDLDAGITYLQIMEQNIANLKVGLSE